MLCARIDTFSTIINGQHGQYEPHWRYAVITETNAVAFRRNLGEMISQVQFRRDSIVIKKDGRAVAVLIDAKLFERIRRMQERFDLLSARLAEAYAAVPEEEGMAEIQRAAAAARTKPKPSAKRKKGRARQSSC